MATKVEVCEWGNSLAIRIPKSFARQRTIVKGAMIDIEKIALVPKPSRRRRSRYNLKDILAKCKGRSHEIDLGPPVGREII